MLTALPGERDDEDEGDSRPASVSNLTFLIAGSSTSCFSTFKALFVLLIISVAKVWYLSKAEKHFLHY